MSVLWRIKVGMYGFACTISARLTQNRKIAIQSTKSRTAATPFLLKRHPNKNILDILDTGGSINPIGERNASSTKSNGLVCLYRALTPCHDSLNKYMLKAKRTSSIRLRWSPTFNLGLSETQAKRIFWLRASVIEVLYHASQPMPSLALLPHSPGLLFTSLLRPPVLVKDEEFGTVEVNHAKAIDGEEEEEEEEEEAIEAIPVIQSDCLTNQTGFEAQSHRSFYISIPVKNTFPCDSIACKLVEKGDSIIRSTIICYLCAISGLANYGTSYQYSTMFKKTKKSAGPKSPPARALANSNDVNSTHSTQDTEVVNANPGSSNSSVPKSHPNIIVFGQTGSGKSSLINLIAGKDVAQTSSDLTKCTFDSQPYHIEVDESLTVTLWDTAGLNQGSRGDKATIMRICELIIRLEKIFCFRDRIRDGTFENYQMFRAICDATVPMAVVVFGLERVPDRVDWWSRNELMFKGANMKFNDHACVVGTRGNRIANSDIFTYGEAYDASAIEVKALIKRAYLSKPRNQDRQQWLAMVLKNMRTLFPGSTSETVTQLDQKLKRLNLSRTDRQEIIKAYNAS
ncbi:hypothetical protein FIBSPDRAFT_925456 [Athelia psychrophila]|uniref:G domain-containing protein n=1 Tax=Athelia psychrophila TaxID=1759441 RepID=A0A166UUR7_9AGAM|nr:hypothetical protein FIBSPDRAFT_925456 [Fibularhizoctonia sp. CBS 109695]